MKTLYFDCGMGAAGDMLTAALLELLPDPDAFLARLSALGIPGVTYEKEPSVKCGIGGTHVTVRYHGEEEDEEMHEHHGHAHHHDHDHGHEHHDHDHEHEHHHDHDHHHDHEHAHEHHDHEHHAHAHEHHEHVHTHVDENGRVYTHTHDDPEIHEHAHEHAHHHSGLHEIEHIVAALSIPEKVRADVMAVYGLIAEAESRAHGVPVTEIHFHEVGTMDAVADVTAVCLLMHELAPQKVVVSPIHVGSGTVRCAHGILPVPAPATAYILRDAPIYGGSIRGELCTPTGAALLKHFASEFGPMPVMRTTAVGYGMGKKDFPQANCVRAFLGETENGTDAVLELSCNVDDMTAEEIGFAMDRLFEGGAREVYTVAVGMKKSRPGTLLRVLCREEEREEMVRLLFLHTTTIGVRETSAKRYVLERGMATIATPYGDVRRKDSAGYGVTRSKYEYDDLARIAEARGVGIEEVRKMVAEIDRDK